VTRSGTGFVSVGAGGCTLLRVDPDQGARCVKVRTIQVLTHRDRVYSTYFRGRRVPYRMLASDDQGRTWRPVPPPGAAPAIS
jgi:hypothetical protein